MGIHLQARRSVERLAVALVCALTLAGAMAAVPAFAGAGSALAEATGAAGTFTALAPSRLLDTRTGVGAPKGALAPGATLTLQVTGRGGVAATGVSAAALNITATAPTKSGYLTVYGAGGTKPTASNLNFAAGQTIANLVVSPIGTNGRVQLYNGSAGTVHVIADVSGYFTAGSVTTSGAFASVPPSRLLDTRTGVGAPKGALAPGATLTLQVTGRGGVAATGVSAAALNVTATAPTKSGYLTVYGAGGTKPTASNLNFAAGQTIANLVVSPIGTNGRVQLYNGSAGTVHVIADVSGYFTAGSVTTSGAFASVPPSRLLDTRTGVGAPKGVLAPGATLTLQVTGRGGVAATGVSAAALNITATAPTKSGYLTVYGAGGTKPTASNLNFAAGQTIANLVVSPIGTNGRVQLYNGSAGTVHVIADVSGYFTDPVAPGAPWFLNASLDLHFRVAGLDQP